MASERKPASDVTRLQSHCAMSLVHSCPYWPSRVKQCQHYLLCGGGLHRRSIRQDTCCGAGRQLGGSPNRPVSHCRLQVGEAHVKCIRPFLWSVDEDSATGRRNVHSAQMQCCKKPVSRHGRQLLSSTHPGGESGELGVSLRQLLQVHGRRDTVEEQHRSCRGTYVCLCWDLSN